MDLFKKGTLKSQSLNSRFLASNNNSNPSVTPRSLPVQVSKPKPTAASQAASTGTASKLKLTTSRGASALKLTRENSSSQGVNDAVQNSSRDVALERKAPVWNKGMPAQKNAKDYTDEELKAMHGISLVARNSTSTGAPKEGRWDDSDEDDAWNDTIDFGDGTKVTIGQTTLQDPNVKITEAVPAKVAPPRPADFTPAHASPFGSALGSPWKRSEFLAPKIIAQPTNSQSGVPQNARPLSELNDINGHVSNEKDIPVNAVVTPAVWDKPSTSHSAAAQQDVQHNSRPEGRPRAESINHETRAQQSGDARYQYDQNSYDRHWQNPQPATREIFNSATGRFEQIDASQKPGRRMSHHDRKAPEVLLRASAATSGDARLPQGQAPALAERRNSRPALSPPIQPSTAVVNGSVNAPSGTESAGKADESKASTEIAATKFDPSSQEFIDMQKKLMAERREQAIQRRKDQEAEENARRERARKKAEELAALAEKEKHVVADVKTADASVKQKTVPKILSRPSASIIENNLAVQKATSEVIQAGGNKMKLNGAKTSQVINAGPWQESIKAVQSSGDIATARNTRPVRRDSFNPATSSSQDQPISFAEKHNATGETYSPTHNVWGAIGSKKTANAIGEENLEAGLTKTNRSIPTSPAASRTANANERASIPSWSAFDGITQSRRPLNTSASEPREYNVFDAADEVLAPEKHKNAVTNQSQNRTSSRFFPSATSAEQNKGSKQSLNLVSPNIPPRLDSRDNPQYADPSTLPALSLPQPISMTSRVKGALTRTIDQVMTSLQDNINDKATVKDSRLSRYGHKGWLDTQTRSVWEIKPLRDGLSPRVKIPYSEKQLDWSRKAKNLPEEKEAPVPQSKPVVSTAIPVVPAWSMPMVLDTTTRDSNIKEPLIPPQPSLKLPVTTDESILARPMKRQQINKHESDRVSKYYTTRPALVEEPDNNSPIRIKTVDVEAQIPRKFGKRLDPAQVPQKKLQDVKRQPVNMSDTPGGSGFKRGFVNRVRGQPLKTTQSPSPTATPLQETRTNNSEKTIATPTPSAILQKASPPVSYISNSPQIMPQMQTSRTPNGMPRGSPVPHFAHRENPMSPKYLPMQSVPPMHAQLNSPLVSRIAPPGLAAPASPIPREENGHGGHVMSTSSIPPPTPRGPPGIV